jgi:hypothetical protein
VSISFYAKTFSAFVQFYVTNDTSAEFQGFSREEDFATKYFVSRNNRRSFEQCANISRELFNEKEEALNSKRERRHGGSNSDCVSKPEDHGWISFQERRHACQIVSYYTLVL